MSFAGTRGGRYNRMSERTYVGSVHGWVGRLARRAHTRDRGVTETALPDAIPSIRPPAEPWEDPATVAPPDCLAPLEPAAQRKGGVGTSSLSGYSPEARFSSAMSAFNSATSACSVRRSVA